MWKSKISYFLCSIVFSRNGVHKIKAYFAIPKTNQRHITITVKFNDLSTGAGHLKLVHTIAMDGFLLMAALGLLVTSSTISPEISKMEERFQYHIGARIWSCGFWFYN